MTITRREVLRGGLGAAGAFALTACGIRGTQQRRVARRSPLPSPSGKLSIATWPHYIDVDAAGRRPTLDRFERKSGIDVTYKEVIEDNESFFSTIRGPLSRDEPTDWDIVVVTDWLVGRMRRLGYLEELHRDELSTVTKQVGPLFERSPDAPLYSVPWQAGIVGIGYNRKLTKQPITSFGDLFDPLFEGKVGMFSDMRDMIHLTLLWKDVDPEDAELEDVEEAKDALVKQRKDGLVRSYYEDDYVDALAKGDIALGLAYSGDVFQLQIDNPDLKFVVPREGGMIFVDEMAVLAGAKHPGDAHKWMNFVYEPKIAAQITAQMQYITPVPAARDVLRKRAAEATGQDKASLEMVASSPLVFPTAAMRKRIHRYRALGEDEERVWNEIFAEVVED